MKIRTNTARLLKHRRMILELMLASHDRDCTTCEKSGKCRLQDLALQFGVRHVRFPDTRPAYEKDRSSPAIVRDPNKCILCGDCVRVCDEMQGMAILNFAHRGSDLVVSPAFDRKLADTSCISCGQCAAACPPEPLPSGTRSARHGGSCMTPRNGSCSRLRLPCGWPWARSSAWSPVSTPWTSWFQP